MSSYRYKPSKPAAVLGIVVGVGMLVFGLTQFGDAEGGRGFLVFWCVGVVAVTVLNTWAAFSAKGSLGTWTRVPDDDPSAH
jgi:FtsH-binding integral membrane protein